MSDPPRGPFLRPSSSVIRPSLDGNGRGYDRAWPVEIKIFTASSQPAPYHHGDIMLLRLALTCSEQSVLLILTRIRFARSPLVAYLFDIGRVKVLS